MLSEIRKLAARRETLILCLITLAALIILLLRVDSDPPAMKKYTRELTEKYHGIPLPDALDELNGELALIDDSVKNDIGSEEYYRYCTLGELAASAEAIQRHNERIIDLLGELQRKTDSAPTNFIRRDCQAAYDMYDRAYNYGVIDRKNALFAVSDYEQVFFSALFALFISALLGELFSIEYESGMYRLLFPAKGGRSKLFLRKTAAAVVLTAASSVIFTAVPFFGVWIRMGLSPRSLAAPIQSVELFDLCPFDMNFLQYLLLSCAGKLIFGVLIMSVAIFASAFLKKGLAIFGVSAGVSVLLILITQHGEKLSALAYFARKTGGASLLEISGYLTVYDTVNVFGTPVHRLFSAMLFTLAVSVFLIICAYGVFTRIFPKIRPKSRKEEHNVAEV